MNWEKKLYQHEVQPPDDVWERIQENLELPISLREKLLSATAQPPIAVWNEIKSAIYSATEQHEQPARRILLRPAFRAAVAAAVLALVCWGGYTVFQNSSEKLPVLNPPSSENTTDEAALAPVSKHKPAMLGAQPILGAAQLAMASLRSRRIKSVNAAETIANVYPVSVSEDYNRHWDYQSQETKPMVGDIDLTQSNHPINLAGLVKNGDGEYFTIQGPNGEPIQVSSKFKDVIYLLNSDTVDDELSEKLFSENKSWRERFKAWKEKMSQSSFTPDNGNFLDIAELIQMLREEKNSFYTQYPLF